LNRLALHGDARGNDKARGRRRRRARRIATLGALGLAPVVAFGWGCSDDEKTGVGPTIVDPGGTHGAEVAVAIIGRGRVQTSIPGLDCPSDCFSKYVFTSKTADGAAGGVTLKATPTPGSRFTGWTFDTEPVGSRGRGPESCNPVKRPGSQPAVDTSASEIVLPFGEVVGTSPAGQEGACGAFTTVPVVYKVTATFVTDPIIEAGVDAGDAGDDGGTPDTVYNPPTVGAISRGMGMTQNGRLWWHYQAAGQDGVAYGTAPSSSIIPQTPQTTSPAPDSTISLFEVDPYGVIYQTTLGTIRVIRYTSSIVTTIPGTPPSCTALSVDSSYNAYCRTPSSIVMWQYPSYSTPITLYTNVPSGTDLLVESSSGPMYFSSSSAILSLPTTDTDGGVASPTTVIDSRFSPRGLEANNSYFWWLESTTSFYTSTGKVGSPTAINTNVPGASGYAYTAQDPATTASYWVANTSSIYRATNSGGGTASTQLFRSGLSNVGGIAVDSQYVYWTQQSDGFIRRASRVGF